MMTTLGQRQGQCLANSDTLKSVPNLTGSRPAESHASAAGSGRQLVAAVQFHCLHHEDSGWLSANAFCLSQIPGR